MPLDVKGGELTILGGGGESYTFPFTDGMFTFDPPFPAASHEVDSLLYAVERYERMLPAGSNETSWSMTVTIKPGSWRVRRGMKGFFGRYHRPPHPPHRLKPRRDRVRVRR